MLLPQAQFAAAVASRTHHKLTEQAQVLVVHTLGVLRGHRRKGLARQLLAAAAQDAADSGFVGTCNHLHWVRLEEVDMADVMCCWVADADHHAGEGSCLCLHVYGLCMELHECTGHGGVCASAPVQDSFAAKCSLHSAAMWCACLSLT